MAKRLLPENFDLERKQGFTMPLKHWFNNGWLDFTKAVLNEADPVIFNKQINNNLINAQNKGYDNTNRLFSLTMFELWRRTYNVSL